MPLKAILNTKQDNNIDTSLFIDIMKLTSVNHRHKK